MNKGKCPKCGSTVYETDTEHVNIGRSPMKQWHGISYLCTSCGTILGIEIDPVALKNDIVNEVVARLK